MQAITRRAKYGVSYDLYFTLEDKTDNEAPYTGGVFAVGDVWISKDGGAAANSTNAPTHISNGLCKLVLTATEMQASAASTSTPPRLAATWMHSK